MVQIIEWYKICRNFSSGKRRNFKKFRRGKVTKFWTSDEIFPRVKVFVGQNFPLILNLNFAKIVCAKCFQ